MPPGHLSSYTGYDGYTQSYRYNAFDLLAEKTSTGNANRLTQEEYVSGRTLENPIEQLQSETTRYTWDITRSFGVLLSETTNGQTTDYDYGFERISAISGNTKTEYLYDPRGSVAAELRYETANSTPNRIELSFKSYSPFGELLTGKQSGFGYNGESYDAATGALYLRARYYEPALNRFSRKDIDRGTVTNPKSLNRYLYTWNNPVSYVDLDGQRVTLPLNLGSGSSSKKATAATPLPSTSKPTPVAFQEQPVTTSANRVQQTIKETATASTPTITPAMQKQLAAAAATGAVGNSMVSPNMAARIIEEQFKISSNRQTPGDATVDSPTEENGGCGKKFQWGKIFSADTWQNIHNWAKNVNWGKVGLMELSGAATIAGKALMASGIGSSFVAGALLASGIGSAIGGLLNEHQGGSFGAGWLGGAVAGAITTYGFGKAAAFFNIASSIEGSAQVIANVIYGFSVSGLSGFLSSFASGVTTQYFDTGSVDIEKTTESALHVGALSTALGPFLTLGNIVYETTHSLGTVIAVGTEYAYDLTISYLDKAIDAADQWINSTANKITDKITNIVKGVFS